LLANGKNSNVPSATSPWVFWIVKVSPVSPWLQVYEPSHRPANALTETRPLDERVVLGVDDRVFGTDGLTVVTTTSWSPGSAVPATCWPHAATSANSGKTVISKRTGTP
jgi:hypothetical protein